MERKMILAPRIGICFTYSIFLSLAFHPILLMVTCPSVCVVDLRKKWASFAHKQFVAQSQLTLLRNASICIVEAGSVCFLVVSTWYPIRFEYYAKIEDPFTNSNRSSFMAEEVVVNRNVADDRSDSSEYDYTSEDEGADDHAVRIGESFKHGNYIVQSKLGWGHFQPYG